MLREQARKSFVAQDLNYSDDALDAMIRTLVNEPTPLRDLVGWIDDSEADVEARIEELQRRYGQASDTTA